ncbi:MAG: TraR/DksA family transcriptional regulator [Actinomycetes bacterium]
MTRKKAPAAEKAVAPVPAVSEPPSSGGPPVPGPRRTRSAASRVAPKLAVRADESPWTADELAGVRAELESQATRLRTEIASAEHDLADLLRDAGDGAGDDQADAGSKAFEREHEMSLANNARDLLLQNERALDRIENGTYGVCESCGNPIGKERLMVFPRATLCVSCKQRQERR